MDFKKEIAKLLSKEVKLPESEVLSLIEVPPNPNLGDFSFPCFKLGNPKEAAEKLKNNLKKPKFISEIKSLGPYLNFFINKSILAEETLIKINKEKNKYGSSKNKEKIVIEFCSPNTNKPLHLGHIRNMSLGDSIVKLLKFQGNNVKAVQIINDRGIHICKSMLAYQKYGNNKLPKNKPDHFVGDYYVMFAKEEKDNPLLNDEAQEMLKKWEEKDPKVLALWKKMNQWVMQGFNETYKRFGVKFDKNYFESAFYEKGKEIAEEGLKKSIFIKDEKGAIIAPLEKYNLSDKVIIRADGTSIYITQDLYLAELRYKELKFNKMMYVVASEQNLHFKQLFKILELLKRPFAKGLSHLSYGMVHLPSGRMKSREGTVIDADDIMNEMSKLAEVEIKKRHSSLPEKETKKRAEIIGLSAIKFFMLKMDAAKDIIFNPEESLSFEGETGPYLQYTHARASSILRKAKQKKGKINFNLLKEPQELAVINLLSQFQEKIKETINSYKPHILAKYLFDLAQTFNEFYAVCPVISENKEQMQVRLLLVQSTKQVLKNGLELLGIEAPEEM
ncbi:MAG TPA: arginine--tRNA ligase [Candidatus Nanoarchaeia archaeon]|nr:arginine--tRNA ligase [Candidatus Nanoarchaeia archaeon]